MKGQKTSNNGPYASLYEAVLIIKSLNGFIICCSQ